MSSELASAGLALSPAVLGMTEQQLSYVVDRLNILVGVILLTLAVYLRFLAMHHVPRRYEYAYLIVGASYIISGVVHASDIAYYVTGIRLIRQLAVIVFAWVFFRHLVNTTNLEKPRVRLRRVWAHIHALRAEDR